MAVYYCVLLNWCIYTYIIYINDYFSLRSFEKLYITSNMHHSSQSVQVCFITFLGLFFAFYSVAENYVFK